MADRHGEVYTYDAPWHRGRDVADPHPISTERFVADLADAVASLGGPLILIGHSMGGLHAWCLAAQSPSWSRALVVEDMAPDFRGRTTGPWEPWLHALPVEFASAQQVFDEFGAVAGQYFLDAFDRTPTGWRLHGHVQSWIDIAAEWGTRDYWAPWRAVRVPALLIEAGNSVTPPGQMLQMHETVAGQRICRFPAPVTSCTTRRPTTYRDAVDLVPIDARPAAPDVGQAGCCSKRVRIASSSCAIAEPVAVVARRACRASERTSGTGRTRYEASPSGAPPSPAPPPRRTGPSGSKSQSERSWQ